MVQYFWIDQPFTIPIFLTLLTFSIVDEITNGWHPPRTFFFGESDCAVAKQTTPMYED